MPYHKGQRLIPTGDNPIKYGEHDFAVFEGLNDDGKLIITVVKRQPKTEPVHWWTERIPESRVPHYLALYRGKVSPSEILPVLQALNPQISWTVLPPSLVEPFSLYRYGGFLNNISQILELDSDLVNEMGQDELRLALIVMVTALFE